MMPRTPSRVASRASLALPVAVAAMLLGAVTTTAEAQPRRTNRGTTMRGDTPVVAGDATLIGSSACGNVVRVTTSGSYRGAAMTLLASPMGDARALAPAPAVAFSGDRALGGGWRIEGGGTVGAEQSPCALRSEWSRGWGAIERSGGNTALYLGLGARAIAAGDPTREREGVTLGASRALLGGVLSLELRGYRQSRERWTTRPATPPSGLPPRNTNGRDTLFNADTGTVVPGGTVSTITRDEWRGLDARTRFRVGWGRLSLDLTVGGTRAVIPGEGTANADSLTNGSGARGARNALRLWGRADARLALFAGAELIGAVSTLPAQPSSATAPRRMGMLGFGMHGLPSLSRTRRDAGAPSAVPASLAPAVVLRESAGTVRLRLRLPGAGVVELSSDASGWAPVAMQQAADGWWEVVLPAPTTHWRVNVRIDGGAWRAPPGLPVLADEFGGAVGILSLS